MRPTPLLRAVTFFGQGSPAPEPSASDDWRLGSTPVAVHARAHVVVAHTLCSGMDASFGRDVIDVEASDVGSVLEHEPKLGREQLSSSSFSSEASQAGDVRGRLAGDRCHAFRTLRASLESQPLRSTRLFVVLRGDL